MSPISTRRALYVLALFFVILAVTVYLHLRAVQAPLYFAYCLGAILLVFALVLAIVARKQKPPRRTPQGYSRQSMAGYSPMRGYAYFPQNASAMGGYAPSHYGMQGGYGVPAMGGYAMGAASPYPVYPPQMVMPPAGSYPSYPTGYPYGAAANYGTVPYVDASASQTSPLAMGEVQPAAFQGVASQGVAAAVAPAAEVGAQGVGPSLAVASAAAANVVTNVAASGYDEGFVPVASPYVSEVYEAVAQSGEQPQAQAATASQGAASTPVAAQTQAPVTYSAASGREDASRYFVVTDDPFEQARWMDSTQFAPVVVPVKPVHPRQAVTSAEGAALASLGIDATSSFQAVVDGPSVAVKDMISSTLDDTDSFIPVDPSA